jgi:hypothetical protein
MSSSLVKYQWADAEVMVPSLCFTWLCLGGGVESEREYHGLWCVLFLYCFLLLQGNKLPHQQVPRPASLIFCAPVFVRTKIWAISYGENSRKSAFPLKKIPSLCEHLLALPCMNEVCTFYTHLSISIERRRWYHCR